MQTRIAAPLPGIYQDFRAAAGGEAQIGAARSAGVNVLFVAQGPPGIRDGVLIVPKPAHLPEPASPGGFQTKHLKSDFNQFPEETFALAGAALGSHAELQFRSFSSHILARDLTVASLEASLHDGRVYTASDWLCDPTGFFFIAETPFGVYDIGDHAPAAETRLRVNLPIAAKISIEQNGVVVAETMARQLSVPVKERGDYKMRATLTINGETFGWLDTMPIHVDKPPQFANYPSTRYGNIHRAIPYVDDGLDQHKLDLYLPGNKRNFPVIVFIPGVGSQGGARSDYLEFGDRFAQAGIAVAIPSYRSMPKDPYPAQEEDAAAAFKWVHQHVAEYGGDPSRIYLGGYSSGGHLASLIALDPKYGLSPSEIRGVISISGIYRVGSFPEFQNADDDPSPTDHAHTGAPPFLLTYCQWDAFGLPRQAREFEAALESKFVPVRLVYIPGENHAFETADVLKPDNATARAILDFIR